MTPEKRTYFSNAFAFARYAWRVLLFGLKGCQQPKVPTGSPLGICYLDAFRRGKALGQHTQAHAVVSAYSTGWAAGWNECAAESRP